LQFARGAETWFYSAWDLQDNDKER